MTPERAQEIVSAINDRAFFRLGMVEKVGSLERVSLAEMLEAKGIVAAGNAEAKQRQEQVGGSISIKVIPDDRLIAATYALEHYHPDNEAVVLMPTTEWPYDRRALGVVGLEPREADQEEET